MILDLFAGPGGWDEGLRQLGLTDVLGIEWDTAACSTARAAGHARRQADVAALEPTEYAGIDGLVVSPPCPSFSAAGKRAGFLDPRGLLTNEPLRWALATRPEWTAWEQVPPVLPVWQAAAQSLRENGYTAWAGVVDAADYGLPQVRRRAVMVARLNGGGDYAELPTPTHGTLRQPHLTMARGIGWGLTRRPATTVVATSNGGPRALDGGAGARRVYRDAVAKGDWIASPHEGDGLAPWYVSLEEASQLQGFPRDYPWHGSTKAEKFRQVGDAVPPPLAAHIVATLTGRVIEAAA